MHLTVDNNEPDSTGPDDGRASPIFALVVFAIISGGLWLGLWKLFAFAVWG